MCMYIRSRTYRPSQKNAFGSPLLVRQRLRWTESVSYSDSSEDKNKSYVTRDSWERKHPQMGSEGLRSVRK